MSNDEKTLKREQLETAQRIKKQQDKTRSRYDSLKVATTKYFQSEYVKLQAEEICRYLKEIELTPFNPWYSELYATISNGNFMSKYYITFNEFGTAEPDYERIKTLILPDPGPEDFPRGTIKFA
jgi:hypothetical protein